MTATVQLSHWGATMAQLSGIRMLLDDIALLSARGQASPAFDLGAGNPAQIPEATAIWQALGHEVLDDGFDAACRYGPTSGSDSLVEAIVDYFAGRYGWDLTPANVLVGPGCQMLCFAAVTVLCGPHDDGRRPVVLPSTPDYTGYQGLSFAEHGVVGIGPGIELGPGRSFRYAIGREQLGALGRPGMFLVSSPANPTGRSLSPGDLAGLVALAEQWEVPLVVDHAYGSPFPRVTGANVEPLWHRRVVNVFTVSKAGLPGERLGFAIGPSDVLRPMAGCLAGCVLHGPQLIQGVVERALRRGLLDHMSKDVIAPYYRAKRSRAEQLLTAHLPADVNWRLHQADGGLFCWLWVDEDWFDDVVLYERLKQRQVFVVPGRYFFAGALASPLAHHASRCFRISLGADEATLAEGIARIGEALAELAGAGRSMGNGR